MGLRVLVTGGAGYIGSHTVIDLISQGYEVVVVDDFSNSSAESLNRVEKLAGKPVKFYEVDVCDYEKFEAVFAGEARFDFVIHFAGLKAVGESVRLPIKYFRNNVTGTLNLLELMERFKCTKLVFSSSATVYGSMPPPFNEDCVTGQGITNPYGETKYTIEQILKYFFISKGAATGEWGISILRYFNPIGAHPSGLIGEDPYDVPNNLMPFIAQVAVGRREYLTIFGDDYETPDGTGVRDYLHVSDLAAGHTAALARLAQSSPTLDIYNLGTGKGVSVKEMLAAMSKACGRDLPFKIGPRRPGDVAVSYAVASKAEAELGWVAKKTLAEACEDVWRWQSQNPNGYR